LTDWLLFPDALAICRNREYTSRIERLSPPMKEERVEGLLLSIASAATAPTSPVLLRISLISLDEEPDALERAS